MINSERNVLVNMSRVQKEIYIYAKIIHLIVARK